MVPARRRRKHVHAVDPGKRLLMFVLAVGGVAVGAHYLTAPNFGRSFPGLPPPEEVRAEAVRTLPPDHPEAVALRESRLARIREGCREQTEARLHALLDSYPGWPEDRLAVVACHRIVPGMTAEQLRASWGNPNRVIPDFDGRRPIERWDYENVSVLLWDGQVRSWQ